MLEIESLHIGAKKKTKTLNLANLVRALTRGIIRHADCP